MLHEYITAAKMSDTMIETAIEPKQPRRFEKKKNMSVLCCEKFGRRLHTAFSMPPGLP
jgi:hypothetical protein